jgi:pilus assembly protein Flp/PilA
MDFMRDESGLGVVEYGLILALVAMVAVGALLVLGGGVEARVDQIGNEFPDGGGSAVSSP